MTPTYFYGIADRLVEVVLHEPPGGRVPEALLQDVWQHQRLRRAPLKTVNGTLVHVIHPGRPNTDAGPDFVGAHLRVGSTRWTGAVEVHVTSGTWLDHRHENDPRYDSTVLHVALYADVWTGRLSRPDGSPLPEIVLYPYLEDSVRRLIHSYYNRTEQHILCAAGWTRVPATLRGEYVQSLAMERLDAKARRFGRGNVDQALYEAVFAGLGYAKNAAPMRTLAHLVPLKLCRTIDEPLDIEALLAGASGLLPAPGELLDADRATADYVMELRDRFERLNHRLEIPSLPATAWRYFRLRPANFPPIRIAQAGALVGPSGLLRRKPIERMEAALQESRPLAALRSLFATSLNDFWTRHVRFDRRSAPRSAAIGRGRIDALLVNVALPALLAVEDSEHRRTIVRQLLHDMPAGQDEVTRIFEALGTRPSSALESQGLHQLYRTRCTEARCLSCRIGCDVLGRSTPSASS